MNRPVMRIVGRQRPVVGVLETCAGFGPGVFMAKPQGVAKLVHKRHIEPKPAPRYPRDTHNDGNGHNAEQDSGRDT